MRLIKLTKDKFTKVDDEDYDFLMNWSWQYSNGYALRMERHGAGNREIIELHRVVMNTPSDLICDHRNHDTLDNQKNNLRNITHSQNLMNQMNSHPRNKLGILGVSKRSDGFRAHICVDRKKIFGKLRKNLDDAIQDRKNLESKYFGEFSYQGA